MHLSPRSLIAVALPLSCCLQAHTAISPDALRELYTFQRGPQAVHEVSCAMETLRFQIPGYLLNDQTRIMFGNMFMEMMQFHPGVPPEEIAQSVVSFLRSASFEKPKDALKMFMAGARPPGFIVTKDSGETKPIMIKLFAEEKAAFDRICQRYNLFQGLAITRMVEWIEYIGARERRLGLETEQASLTQVLADKLKGKHQRKDSTDAIDSAVQVRLPIAALQQLDAMVNRLDCNRSNFLAEMFTILDAVDSGRLVLFEEKKRDASESSLLQQLSKFLEPEGTESPAAGSSTP